MQHDVKEYTNAIGNDRYRLRNNKYTNAMFVYVTLKEFRSEI